RGVGFVFACRAAFARPLEQVAVLCHAASCLPAAARGDRQSGRSIMDMVGKPRKINISCESLQGDLMAESRREPIIRTVPHPSDLNGNGDVFGGWVLAQMDIAGGVLASRLAKGRIATVAITAMTFVQPIKVGDVVSIYGHVARIGRSSITIDLETMVQRRHDTTDIQVTHGTFVFVAIDEQGKPRPVPQEAMA